MAKERSALTGTGRRIPEDAQHVRPIDPSASSSVSLYGVDESKRPLVEAFAAAHGLKAEGFDPQRRFVRLTGHFGALQHAFGVTVKDFEIGGETFHGHSEDISLPNELQGIAVFGLDNLPAARPRT